MLFKENLRILLTKAQKGPNDTILSLLDHMGKSPTEMCFWHLTRGLPRVVEGLRVSNGLNAVGTWRISVRILFPAEVEDS